MLGSVPTPRLKTVDTVAQRVKSRAPQPLKSLVFRFVQHYFRGVADDDLATHDTDTLAAIALTHLGWGLLRRDSRPLVKVFNPDPTTDGVRTPNTVAMIVCDDMPFLVDSVCMAATQSGLAVRLIVHPILASLRTNGRLVDVPEDHAAATGMESWQWLELDRIEDPTRLAELEARIHRALDDVHAAVTDWPAMRDRALELATTLENGPFPVAAAERAEIAALLAWMADNHFTFLGARYYRLQRGSRADHLVAEMATGLGILRDGHAGRAESDRTLSGAARDRARDTQPITVTKANALATVHRATHLDYVGLKTFDSQGRVTGEHRFLGLWTSGMYTARPRDIPLLRHKIARVIDHFGLAPSSHDAKALVHALDNYPRDELFQATADDLISTVRGIVNLYDRQIVRVFLRRDTFHRYWSCLIYVPRDRYGTEVRRRIESIALDVLDGDAVESSVQLSESTLARLQLVVRTHRSGKGGDAATLEARIRAAVLTWDDSLREALTATHGESRALSLVAEYARGLPAAYREDTSAADAAADIDRLESLSNEATNLRLYRRAGTLPARANLRLYTSATPKAISDLLPILENLGLRLISERPYTITRANGGQLQVQDFELETRHEAPISVDADGDRIAAAVEAVWRRDTESDGFNRLVLAAGLQWREVTILRSYSRWLLQTGIPFSQNYMESVLLQNAKTAGRLVQLFRYRFDPTLSDKQRRTVSQRLSKEIDTALGAVQRLDEDRILRSFRAAIEATVRTNYYQTRADGKPKPYLSVKIASGQVPGVPLPYPLFEIWTHSVRIEGVHLRKGKVARGGLRWSDRYEDFRTEILGLMKAQNVKNTVIVPVGAKGGFVCRSLPAGRDEQAREVVACYQTFIHSLLDLTDNIVDGQVVPPLQTVRHDEDDTYLVVAADKGTAAFSDVANAIAEERQFWLGDAFASGGSAGYDHKKMAITSRGAWECVKRHFRELGVDTQSQPFTVAGIGDMSGDVFGNGLLRSKHAMLVAAFNHQHIFLDPSPDADASFNERERLFRLPRSSWADYDSNVISQGGGVHARAAKSIPLSPEAKRLLGLASDSAPPNEVIKAILKLPVDLLWNGGIGTYVKSSSESHAAIGDRANDAVRVDGRELRCRVVGEGGNLGFSQLGRVEYALNGGRINTDFIDNSGGVNCSDLEVNIKILMRLAADRRGLKRSTRDSLLAQMTDEVAGLVLRNNYLQGQALSALEARSVERAGEHLHAIAVLEKSVDLSRGIEFLPTDSAVLERAGHGKGLTRPELSILLSYSKIWLNQQLVESDVPEDPYLSNELVRYFPPELAKRYGDLLSLHPLRREIIATATTNSVINRMGPGFVIRTEEDTGATVGAIVRAYAIAREATAMRDLWGAIEALDNRVDSAVQTEMANLTTRALKLATHWVLAHRRTLAVDANVAALRPSLTALGALAPDLLAGRIAGRIAEIRTRLLSAGVPDALATGIAQLELLPGAFDIVELATQLKRPLPTVTRIHMQLDAELGLDDLRVAIQELATKSHWQSVARSSLGEELHRLHRALTENVLGARRPGDPARATTTWLQSKQRSVDHFLGIARDIQASGPVDFPTLSVALQSLRRLAGA
jgi:glutamate dehydrogenase